MSLEADRGSLTFEGPTREAKLFWHQRDQVIMGNRWGGSLFRGHPLLIQLPMVNQSQFNLEGDSQCLQPSMPLLRSLKFHR